MDFVDQLREFASSGETGPPASSPVGKPATIITPTGSLSVGSIAGFEVGCVLIIDAGAHEERFMVEEIDGNNCRVRPWGTSGDRRWWVFRRLVGSLRRLWPWSRW